MPSPLPAREAAIPVLLLFGPTASGKTAILKRLFGGKGGPGRAFSWPEAEIVSADSMQVYRGMDTGTAKPTAAERALLPHHLIDIRNPDEQFNAGDFVRLADEACRDIARRGKLPVVSGGTGFYLRNFVLGLPAAPPSDPAVREKLREELRVSGAATLMAELARADPPSAERIHPNDTYRLLRALEVFRISRRPLSSFPPYGAPAGAPEGGFNGDGAPVGGFNGDGGIRNSGHPFGGRSLAEDGGAPSPEGAAAICNNAAPVRTPVGGNGDGGIRNSGHPFGGRSLAEDDGAPSPEGAAAICNNAAPVRTPVGGFNGGGGGRPAYRFLVLALRRDREELYRRIDERCALMFRSGLPAEARRLYEAGYTPRDPGLRAIGYREFFVEEPGEGRGETRYRLSEDLAGVETLTARNSRRYAKRQITYMSSLPGVRWIDCSGENAPDPAERIGAELETFSHLYIYVDKKTYKKLK